MLNFMKIIIAITFVQILKMANVRMLAHCAQQCLGQRYGLKTLLTTRKPPFLTKFGLRFQVQASGFELTTPILEAARFNQ